MSARHAIGQRRVLLPPDPVEAVEDLIGGLCLKGVTLVMGLLVLFRIKAVDLKSAFHLSRSWLSARTG